jgi:hypothetical protein
LNQCFYIYIEIHSRQRGNFADAFLASLSGPDFQPGRSIGLVVRGAQRTWVPGDCPMTSPLQQKLKITGPVVVTANRLGDGAVVYRTLDGSWSARLDEAAVVNTVPAATELLSAAVADDISAVGAYVAPVRIGPNGRPEPGNLREIIRHAGPTVELPITFGI